MNELLVESDPIESSSAFANTFFRVAGPSVTRGCATSFIRNWFPITRTFALALPGYVALISGRLKNARGLEREALEDGILVPMAICAGEYGVGMPCPGIHYRLFAQLGEPFGIGVDDLLQTPRGTTPATGKLVEAIENSMKDIATGAACIRVVEKTAYNIVDAMNRMFRPLEGDDGRPLLSKEQMTYIEMHLEIEKIHDEITVSFFGLLREQDADFAAVMDAEIDRLCVLFGAFWETQAKSVFGHLVEQPLKSLPSL